MSEKKEWVLKAFKGEKVDRVPVGFWHHFTSEDEWLHGFSNPAIIEKNIQNHPFWVFCPSLAVVLKVVVKAKVSWSLSICHSEI